MKIKLNSIFVDDQDKALRFYTEVLGFVKKQDFPAGWAARRERPVERGLLVIYPLDLTGAGLEGVEPTVVGFLAAFPYNPAAPGIKYVMPRRYFEDAP